MTQINQSALTNSINNQRQGGSRAQKAFHIVPLQGTPLFINKIFSEKTFKSKFVEIKKGKNKISFERN